MKDLRYGTDELEASILVLKKAEEDFADYTRQFLAGTTDTVAKFNSDFASQIAHATRNMEDTKAPKLQSAMAEYRAAVQYAARQTKLLDEGIGAAEEKIMSVAKQGWREGE